MSNPYAWKAQLLSSEIKLQGLLKEDHQFDEATFLYELYKTSTVTEVANFKWSLEDVQRKVIEKGMLRLLERAGEGHEGFEKMSKDLLQAKKWLSEEADPEVARLSEMRDR